jgi:hypothetical protein
VTLIWLCLVIQLTSANAERGLFLMENSVSIAVMALCAKVNFCNLWHELDFGLSNLCGQQNLAISLHVTTLMTANLNKSAKL